MMPIGTPAANRWIAYRQPRPEAQLRLFCLPYSGAGASVYRIWGQQLPDRIEVCPIQLPGREQRFREKPFTRVGPLVSALCVALDRELDVPFSIFGYSAGAAVAYELAVQLRQRGHASPVELLLAARPPPHTETDLPLLHRLPDRALCEELREFGSTAEAMLEMPELMAMLLPVIRADIELNETYRTSGEALLDCPITVFGGLQDRRAKACDLTGWGQLTSGSCRVRLFPGGHFFLHESSQSVIAAVAEILGEHTTRSRERLERTLADVVESQRQEHSD